MFVLVRALTSAALLIGFVLAGCGTAGCS